MAFRMDDRKQRIIVDADGGEGIGFFGWEVADAAALDALAARLEKAGVTVARGSRALADERRVKDLIVLQRPGRQPARAVPRRRDHGRCRSSPAARSPASAPARSASAMW